MTVESNIDKSFGYFQLVFHDNTKVVIVEDVYFELGHDCISFGQ